jgi:hypothetical protein
MTTTATRNILSYKRQNNRGATTTMLWLTRQWNSSTEFRMRTAAAKKWQQHDSEWVLAKFQLLCTSLVLSLAMTTDSSLVLPKPGPAKAVVLIYYWSDDGCMHLGIHSHSSMRIMKHLVLCTPHGCFNLLFWVDLKPQLLCCTTRTSMV